jgi:hypothetical protein
VGTAIPARAAVVVSRVAVHLLDEIAIRSRRKSYSPAAGQLRSILLARNYVAAMSCQGQQNSAIGASFLTEISN